MPEQSETEWDSLLTPAEINELEEGATSLNDLIEDNIRRMREAKPIYQQTGEIGHFCGFVGVFPRIKPVYKTQSGVKFFVAQKGKEDVSE